VENPARPSHPIHDLIANRFSPRAFGAEQVTAEQLAQVLEAARWAASCFNEQPWSYIVSMRAQTDAFEVMLSCLVDWNRQWASRASVLVLSVARTTFAASGQVNRHAWHDVGQASMAMAIQATAMGLRVHSMAGFDVERARHLYRIPEGYEPVAVMALGYPGDPSTLPEKLRVRELAERTRKPLSEFVFAGAWGERLPGLGD